MVRAFTLEIHVLWQIQVRVFISETHTLQEVGFQLPFQKQILWLFQKY